jgi:hypothetical protein
MVRLGHPRRLLLGGATLLAVLLTGSLLPPRAHAMISSCRTDPIITLSDGTQLDITASIDTPPGLVNAVKYTVHVPAGLSMTNVVFTGGPFAKKESLSFYADQKSGTYSTTTFASTQSTTSMSSTSLLRRGPSASINGQTGHNLTVNF